MPRPGREYDEQISQEQDTKKSLEEKLAQHEATYDQALAQLDAQIKTLTEQRDPDEDRAGNHCQLPGNGGGVAAD